ncbi:CAMK/CAMKL protein kinase [Aphanomyces invadans]|nr:CAMK/CAMKL protein kinase [Aphanomyces invadans]ETW02163.1 CAMK/CAMKL protein kinase [Aphanomyces invadans]|eukprot:XP_008868768.1 CAMK/CAMKL protein kinase [Aphanomyces invadans]
MATRRYMPVRPLLAPDVVLCRDVCTDMNVVLKRNKTTPVDVDVECTIYHMLQAAGGHPNILPLLECFHDDDSHVCLVLEYCPNGDLFDLVLANKRIGTHMSLVYFEQLASAVAALHQLGYAHGDLSLENVLLGRDMQIQLMDFGAAMPLQVPTNWAGGKRNYMAPESFTGLPWDPAAADVWALAMTFFAMLTGDFMLDESVVNDPVYLVLVQQGFRGILQNTPQWAALIPNAVVPLLEQMFHVDPRARPSMETVLQYAKFVLALLLNEEAASSSSPPATRSHSPRHKIMRPRTLYRFNDIYARIPAATTTTAFVHCV